MQRGQRLWLALALTALGAQLCRAGTFDVPRVKTRVGVNSGNDLPFHFYDPATGNETGFEVPLREALCQLASLDCEVVVLETAPDNSERVVALQNGDVDWVISLFSVTPNRSELVDFVHPYYYNAGAALYALKQNHQLLYELGGWEGLQGRPVCLKTDYYANDQLVRTYDIDPVYFNTPEEGLALVKAGKCDAVAYDSSTLTFDVGDVAQVSSVQPAFTAPYAVAVAKGNVGLANRLSAALVRVMKDGTRSPILAWEDGYMLAQGIPSSQDLQKVVEAISYFGIL